MSKSKAQKFAQKRNTAGGTLKGVVVNLENNIEPVATDRERKIIEDCRKKLRGVYNGWSNEYEQAKSEHL